MLSNPFVLVALPTVIAAGLYVAGVAALAAVRLVRDVVARRRWRRQAAGRRARLKLPQQPKPNRRRAELAVYDGGKDAA